jgi:hypothetical protein
VLNENDAITEMLDYFTFDRYQWAVLYHKKIKMVFVDDTEYNYERTREYIGLYGYAYYIRGSGNYGASIIKGMQFGYEELEADKIIIMDIDHPRHFLINMINMLDEHDLVIGSDLNMSLKRRFTRLMCSMFLGIKVSHPTCGFLGFNSDIVDKLEPWKAKSSYDIFHVELLKKAWDLNLTIGEVNFNTLGTDITHNYNIRRYVKWLVDFFSMYWRVLNNEYP